jgi:hypothetical protein
MARLMQANRRATNRQITTQYNRGVQNGISECTTRQSLSQMGYCSRWPHGITFHNQIKTRSGSSGHAITNTELMRTGKTLPGPTNPRIWRKQHESMEPSCLVQAGGGGIMLWGMFFLAHVRSLHTNRAKQTFLSPCRIHAPEDSGCFGGKDGVRAGTRWMYLKNWLVSVSMNNHTKCGECRWFWS